MTPQPSLGWFQADGNPDTATSQTVGFMCKLVDRAAKWQPFMSMYAAEAAEQFAGDPLDNGSSPNASTARSVYWWAKHNVTAVPHSQFKALIAAYPEKRQLLVDPCALLVDPDPKGDCSTFTLLICAFLRCLGVPYELVTVAVDPRQPWLFSHVYPRAVLEGGARLPLDASHGEYPGWEVPAERVYRKQVWDASGTPIPDKQVAQSSLGEYIAWPGLGQDDGSDLTNIDVGGYSPLDWGGEPAPIVGDTETYTVSASALPSDSSGGMTPFEQTLASIFPSLAKAGTGVAQALNPMTTVRLPNGEIITAPAGSLSSTSLSSLASAGGISTSTLLLLGVGLAAFLLLSHKG